MEIYKVIKTYRGGKSEANLIVMPPNKVEDVVDYFADTEMPGGREDGYELEWFIVTDPQELLIAIDKELAKIKKQDEAKRIQIQELERMFYRLAIAKKKVNFNMDKPYVTVLDEWDMAVATNTHHFWCNYNPISPVEDCNFCKKSYVKYPPSKGADALMQEHFPDAIIRK